MNILCVMFLMLATSFLLTGGIYIYFFKISNRKCLHTWKKILNKKTRKHTESVSASVFSGYIIDIWIDKYVDVVVVVLWNLKLRMSRIKRIVFANVSINFWVPPKKRLDVGIRNFGKHIWNTWITCLCVVLSLLY